MLVGIDVTRTRYLLLGPAYHIRPIAYNLKLIDDGVLCYDLNGCYMVLMADATLHYGIMWN